MKTANKTGAYSNYREGSLDPDLEAFLAELGTSPEARETPS